jgi:hypothetical protein
VERVGTILERDAVIILGSGYTGRFLAPLAARQYSSVYVTSRNPEKHLPDVPADRRILFDLEQPGTWTNIPASADLVWCFPAAPIESVQRCAAALQVSARRIVVLGSTSAYDIGGLQEYPPVWIDESAPIDMTKTRVQGEEYLRKEHGAIVLRVAGIYGPGRNPFDWITSGRVRPSSKFVNLIHVEDLAAICLLALVNGTPSDVYNVSDGMPRTWLEIYHAGRDRGYVPAIPEEPAREAGKRIDTKKLRKYFGEAIRHTDLGAAFDALERTPATSAAAQVRPDRPADC